MEEQEKQSQCRSLLKVLLEDPLLGDVPRDRPTVALLDALISVELGNAMRLSILKLDGSQFEVAVRNTATVRELRAAIQEKIESLDRTESGRRRCLSWKHVWSTYCLFYGNQSLTDGKTMLQDLGVKNHDQVRFENYILTREMGRHSRAKRRRY